MIIFFYGTTAEAIKIAPIARRLTKERISYQQWVTNQHAGELKEILPELGLAEPTLEIVNGIDGKPVKTVVDTLHWLWRILRWYLKNRKSLIKKLNPNSVIVVHGDTITTVIGALFAKGLGIQSAHVEAGLRSGSWRHPFPEELDRMMVGQIANIHYVPTRDAEENLKKKPNVVYTHGNTAIDAVLDHDLVQTDGDEKFGVMLLHRFEFLTDESLIRNTLETIQQNAPFQVLFFADQHGQELLNKYLPDTADLKLRLQRKLPHREFTQVLHNAAFVLTDSGGVQAEAALIGVPTLLHRMTTEQREGLGENLILSHWDMGELASFLRDYKKYRTSSRQPEVSPSDIIVEDLRNRGFLQSPSV